MKRGVAFVTTDAEPGLQMLARLRQGWPEHQWTVYAPLPHHAWIAAAWPDATLIDDKPRGSRLAFIRGLRRARYDQAVVAWHGHAHHDRMKLVALLSGATCIAACDEAMQMIVLRRGCAGAWIAHLRRRERQGLISPWRLLAGLGLLYGATAGWLVAAVRAAWTAARWPFLLRSTGRGSARDR